MRQPCQLSCSIAHARSRSATSSNTSEEPTSAPLIRLQKARARSAHPRSCTRKVLIRLVHSVRGQLTRSSNTSCSCKGRTQLRARSRFGDRKGPFSRELEAKEEGEVSAEQRHDIQLLAPKRRIDPIPSCRHGTARSSSLLGF